VGSSKTNPPSEAYFRVPEARSLKRPAPVGSIAQTTADAMKNATLPKGMPQEMLALAAMIRKRTATKADLRYVEVPKFRTSSDATPSMGSTEIYLGLTDIYSSHT